MTLLQKLNNFFYPCQRGIEALIQEHTRACNDFFIASDNAKKEIADKLSTCGNPHMKKQHHARH